MICYDLLCDGFASLLVSNRIVSSSRRCRVVFSSPYRPCETWMRRRGRWVSLSRLAWSFVAFKTASTHRIEDLNDTPQKMIHRPKQGTPDNIFVYHEGTTWSGSRDDPLELEIGREVEVVESNRNEGMKHDISQDQGRSIEGADVSSARREPPLGLWGWVW